ncbi:MAG: glycosyltransferase family 4 protein [Anaerolineae bacterium]
MRIALVVHKFPPSSLGGTEIYTRNLAQGLADRGHEVSVFYRDDGEGTEFREGWMPSSDYRIWRVGRAFDPSSAHPASLFFDTFFNRDVEASFRRFLEQSQPDLVHFQHLMLLSIRLPNLVKQAGIQALLTLHDYWFRCANSQLIWPDGQVCRGKLAGINCARCAVARLDSGLLKAASPLLAPLFQWRDHVVKRAALEVGHFVAPSRFLRERYLEVGFPADSIAVVENGIDVDRIRAFPPKPSKDGSLRVTYLGSLAWQKGVHVLVEAMQGLPPERIRLRVFGSQEPFPDYVAKLRSLVDPANTVLEGAVPNAQVGRILAETDILAVPSLWYENSPVVIQEAHAAGVPVLASDLGALAEKVQDDVDGGLIPPGDVVAWREALVELARDSRKISDWSSHVEPPRSLAEHVTGVEWRYRGIVACKLVSD